jgi:hypothetical protein
MQHVTYRGGRNRTDNLRFWRPLLCQLSYAPIRYLTMVTRRVLPGRPRAQWSWYPRFCFIRHLSQTGCAGLAAPGLPGVTRPDRCRCGETEPWARPTHLAPGCTLAQPGTLLHPAGGLLPHRFTPYPGSIYDAAGAGLLSVAVVVRRPLPTACPHLLFREATLPARIDRLGVGKFLCISMQRRIKPHGHLALSWADACVDLRQASVILRRPRQDSNLRPQRPQRCALSPELRGHVTGVRRKTHVPLPLQNPITPGSGQSHYSILDSACQFHPRAGIGSGITAGKHRAQRLTRNISGKDARSHILMFLRLCGFA